jgi:hypothetical protein
MNGSSKEVIARKQPIALAEREAEERDSALRYAFVVELPAQCLGWWHRRSGPGLPGHVLDVLRRELLR